MYHNNAIYAGFVDYYNMAGKSKIWARENLVSEVSESDSTLCTSYFYDSGFIDMTAN